LPLIANSCSLEAVPDVSYKWKLYGIVNTWGTTTCRKVV
jgi:hypothetical protein